LLYKPRTQAEIDEITVKAAKLIEKHELEEVAMLFFESIKPVSRIGGKLGGMALAFLIPVFGYGIDDYLVALQEPEQIEKLLKMVEASYEKRREKEKQAKLERKLAREKEKEEKLLKKKD